MALNPPAIVPTKITTAERLALVYVEPGATYYDTTIGATVVTENGGLPAVAKWTRTIGSSVLFVGKSDKTVLNTETETSLSPATFTGSLTIPANTLSVSDTLKMRISGNIRTDGPNEIISFKLGSAQVFSSILDFNLANITSPVGFELEIDMTVREIGAALTAQIATNMQFTYSPIGVTIPYQGKIEETTNATTFDTTVAITFGAFVKWASASALNSIVTKQFSLELLGHPIT